MLSTGFGLSLLRVKESHQREPRSVSLSQRAAVGGVGCEAWEGRLEVQLLTEGPYALHRGQTPGSGSPLTCWPCTRGTEGSPSAPATVNKDDSEPKGSEGVQLVFDHSFCKRRDFPARTW